MIENDELNRICKEWSEREYRTIDKVMLRTVPAVLPLIDKAFRSKETDPPNTTETAEQIVAALGIPPSAPLLAVVYLYARALRHWQMSMKQWPVELVVEVCNALKEHLAGQEERVFSAFGDYVIWLRAGYNAENGLNCSCPVKTRNTGQTVREAATTFSAKLDAIRVSDPDVAQIVQILKVDVEAHTAYFGALERVAATVKGLADGALGSAQLDKAIDDVATAFKTLEGDSHHSNLKPQLAMLETLQQDQPKDWLRIDSARLRYCYPFAILTKEGSNPFANETEDRDPSATSRTEDEKEDLPEILEALTTKLQSTTSWLPRQERRSDLWLDAQDAVSYTIELPNVTIKTETDEVHRNGWAPDDEEELDYSCEIRMRPGGNHSLVVTHQFRLPDGLGSPGAARALRSLHLLNQAFRRATGSMGNENISFEGDEYPTIAKLVEHILTELALQLTRVQKKDIDGHQPESVVPPSRGPTDDDSGKDPENCGSSIEVVSDRSTSDLPLAVRDVHIIVSQIDVRLEPGCGAPRHARPADLCTAVGSSLLTREVRQMAATSIEEWLLQEPSECDNLFEKHARRGELALGTANTTILFMPHSPDWVILDEHEEMADFVASQKALYRMWERQLERREDSLRGLTTQLRRAVEDQNRRPPQFEEMQSAVLALRDQQATINAEVARLHSLSVVSTQGYLDLLEALVKSTSLPRLESDLQAKLRSLSEEYDHIAAMTAAIGERRSHHSASIVEFVIGALAVFGLLSWVRDVFEQHGWRGIEVGLAIAAVVTIVLLALRMKFYWVKRSLRSPFEYVHRRRVLRSTGLTSGAEK
jgi:hypothetical protein